MVRKLKSLTRLNVLTLITWLQGVEMILWRDFEVDYIHEPEGTPYSELDREMLEMVIKIDTED